MVQAVAHVSGLSRGRVKSPPSAMEKAARESGLGKIQLLSLIHVEFKLSISQPNRGVSLAVEFTDLETTLACRLQSPKTKQSKKLE